MEKEKRGIRIIGIDDAPFDKYKDKEVLVVGVILRNGEKEIIEGILSTKIKKDGEDSSEKIIKMIHGSKFKDQIRLIFVHGTTLGGLNILDLKKVYDSLKIPIIAILKRKPRISEVKNALIKAGKEEEIKNLKLNFEKVGRFYVSYEGCSKEEFLNFLELGVSSLRIAHLIGSGIMKGESSGRL